MCVGTAGASYASLAAAPIISPKSPSTPTAPHATKQNPKSKPVSAAWNSTPLAPTPNKRHSKPKKLKKDPAESKGVAARVEGLDHAGSPSSEASEDVAPVGHSPETLDQKMRERSKYEAAEPYRSKKGDRFS